MRAIELETERRFDTPDLRGLDIVAYDTANDYPQRVLSLSRESGAVKSCLEEYIKFVKGGGIVALRDLSFRNGQRFFGVYRAVVADLCRFGGMAIHVDYNGLGEAVDIQHVPFEHCRLCIPDSDTGRIERIAVNRDWTGVKKAPKKDNTQYVRVFNPDRDTVLREIEQAGGIAAYSGQILYTSLDADNVYPLCRYDARLTDAATEVSISNVKYRNAQNNFMPAAVVVLPEYAGDTPDNNAPERHRDERIEAIRKTIGSKNACKLLVFTRTPGDSDIEVKPIEHDNYDGAFINTEKTIKENIGQAFTQPPILRCEQVSNGFADDMMVQAYNFYNSVTQEERDTVEDAFRRIFGAWYVPIDLDSIKIERLKYGSDAY